MTNIPMWKSTDAVGPLHRPEHTRTGFLLTQAADAIAAAKAELVADAETGNREFEDRNNRLRLEVEQGTK